MASTPATEASGDPDAGTSSDGTVFALGIAAAAAGSLFVVALVVVAFVRRREASQKSADRQFDGMLTINAPHHVRAV